MNTSKEQQAKAEARRSAIEWIDLTDEQRRQPVAPPPKPGTDPEREAREKPLGEAKGRRTAGHVA